MTRFFTAVLMLLAILSRALGADDPACLVASGMVQADFALQRVAAALQNNDLKITVIGSASSIVAGVAGANAAYPVRLEATLKARLPAISVKVISHAKPRQTAAEMAKELDRVLMDEKPALVVWQTGTVDAMRGVDPEEFRSTLDEGIDTVQAGGADIIFMNMQYSPRTDSMISAAPYADAIRFVALQREVPLFDRLAVMRQWYEMGTFDLSAASKNTELAERVHNCIAQLLADLIIDSAKLAEPTPKDVH
jgi:lysophospholipase L1-like esterase